MYENSEITQTDYLAGFQYKGDKLMFFPTAEGYVNNTIVDSVNVYSYVYNHTDHLGNIRLSYTQDPTNPEELVILEENNYYPFGLKHGDYNKDIKEIKFEEYIGIDTGEIINMANQGLTILPTLENEYHYKYNGKELQDELDLNVYDYGWRQYDPAIGRWQAVDPLAESTGYPYAAMDNNPINLVDPDGRAAYPPAGYEGFFWSDADGSFFNNWDGTFTNLSTGKTFAILNDVVVTGSSSYTGIGPKNQSNSQIIQYSGDFASGVGEGFSRIKDPKGYVALSTAKTGKGLYFKPDARGLNNLKGTFVNVPKTVNVVAKFGKGAGPLISFGFQAPEIYNGFQESNAEGIKQSAGAGGSILGGFVGGAGTAWGASSLTANPWIIGSATVGGGIVGGIYGEEKVEELNDEIMKTIIHMGPYRDSEIEPIPDSLIPLQYRTFPIKERTILE